MKKLSRKKLMAINILIAASGVFLIAGALTTSFPLVCVSTALLAASLTGMALVHRCPYCRAPFRGLVFAGTFLNKLDAGYCRKCGQRMEIDYNN